MYSLPLLLLAHQIEVTKPEKSAKNREANKKYK